MDSHSTPKKIKHKHKPIKLAVLKYYKVDSDGKIKRLRRECPAETCGAGVFMAAHKDRQYCGTSDSVLSLWENCAEHMYTGKCHLTFMLE